MEKWIGLIGAGVAVFGLSYHYSRRFLDWLRFQSLGTRDYIVQRMGMMFVEIPPHQILLGLFGLSFGLGILTFAAFIPQIFPGIVFGTIVTIIGWKAPRPIVDYMYKLRVEKLTLQLVDGLNLMSNGMKSGLSVVQAMGLVVQEMPDPIQQEFNLVLSENRLGIPLEEALNSMSKRVISDDVEMLVTSINILKETGGNLAETFDTISGTIRERVKVQKKITAMTTQGFYQGMILMSVPPLLGLILYQTDPEMMSPLFTTALGWIMVMVIIVLEVIGFFVIMKVIKIDV